MHSKYINNISINGVTPINNFNYDHRLNGIGSEGNNKIEKSYQLLAHFLSFFFIFLIKKISARHFVQLIRVYRGVSEYILFSKSFN